MYVARNRRRWKVRTFDERRRSLLLVLAQFTVGSTQIGGLSSGRGADDVPVFIFAKESGI